MTSPSVQTDAVDFSHYLPPGVYSNPQPGPQLAVNVPLPTAVGIIGQAVGYRTYIETIQVNPDEVGAAPTVAIASATTGQGPVNDQQTVTLTGSPGGGTFTLTFTTTGSGGSTQTTAAIAGTASNTTVQTALTNLSNIQAGNVTVTGANGGPWIVTFGGALAASAQPVFTADGSGLSGGSTPGVSVVHTTTGAASTNAQQSITVTGVGGSFSLTFGGNTTVPIPYNAPATSVGAALIGLSTIAVGGVAVSGSNGGPYTVLFTGTLGGLPQPLLTATAIPALNPALNQTLAQRGINQATIVVSNPNSGAAFVLNTDYTVVNTGGTNGTTNALYTVERVITGHINPNDYVQITYQYTDPTYYTPYIFYDYADVVACYGAPWDVTTGTIQSGLSLMAYFAFLNGAYQVVCVAVQADRPTRASLPPPPPPSGTTGWRYPISPTSPWSGWWWPTPASSRSTSCCRSTWISRAPPGSSAAASPPSTAPWWLSPAASASSTPRRSPTRASCWSARPPSTTSPPS